MKKSQQTFLFVTFLLLVIPACRTIEGWLDTPFSAPNPTPIPLHDLEITPNSTPVILTPTPHQPHEQNTVELESVSIRPTPTLSALNLEEQLNVFHETWDIVNEEYLYIDFNGVDWEQTQIDYEERIKAGMETEEFYSAMDAMIYSLGDDHSIFLSPQMVAADEAEYEGRNEYVGIGIIHMAVPERGISTIILTFPGSPAEQVGLKPHDNILTVDGQPILDEDGYIQDIIFGPVGSYTSLGVQTPGKGVREVIVQRTVILSPVPTPWALLSSPEGQRIGYLMITTFSDSNTPDNVETALEALTSNGPLDGLIIDNRMNGGGAHTVFLDTLRYFTSGTIGYFVNRTEEETLKINGLDINGSLEVPLVVLIGPDTVSFGEVFAGVLQERERAYLIGETTYGNVEILYGYNLPYGSQLWIAHDTFRPAINPDQVWENAGVTPDLQIPSAWDLYTTFTDPAVIASLEYFDAQ
jgi:carboxyl-terminal processing protease